MACRLTLVDQKLNIRLSPAGDWLLNFEMSSKWSLNKYSQPVFLSGNRSIEPFKSVYKPNHIGYIIGEPDSDWTAWEGLSTLLSEMYHCLVINVPRSGHLF